MQLPLKTRKSYGAGQLTKLPNAYSCFEAIDCGGRLLTPGLIDCHTHVVFGGNRAKEFEMRLEGASYEEVARAGGGIVSTVAATRESSEEELLVDALRRIDAMIAEGVTTLEVKSGYGLDIVTELKMLRVARKISQTRGSEYCHQLSGRTCVSEVPHKKTRGIRI